MDCSIDGLVYLLLGEIVGLHTRWCQPKDTDWVQGRRELYLYIYIYIHGSFIHYSFLSCLSLVVLWRLKKPTDLHTPCGRRIMEKGGGTRVSIDLPHHSVWMFIVTSFNRAPIPLRPVNIVVPFVYFPRRPRVVSLCNQKNSDRYILYVVDTHLQLFLFCSSTHFDWCPHLFCQSADFTFFIIRSIFFVCLVHTRFTKRQCAWHDSFRKRDDTKPFFLL